MDKEPMTKRGAALLEEELTQLKSVERPQIIAAISEAREHGDLKENAEYHAAREKQSFVEGRIRDIESKLSNAQVIDVAKLVGQEKVVFGATVTLLNVDTEEEVTYQLVGDDESDIKAGLISIRSPIARSLIGKFCDDEVVVKAPSGEIVYVITNIDYK
jgi:transcription elongation factor GreA